MSITPAQNSNSAAALNPFGSDTKDIQDRFLKMLVAQLKNQDPLSPMDNAAVTSQMAQLNTVTGIQNLNSSMKDLLGSIQSQDLMRATSLIGRSVVVNGSNVAVSNGQSSPVMYRTDSASSDNVFEVTNSQGDVLYKRDLGSAGAGMHQVSWDGRDSNGAPLPDGLYNYHVSSVTAGVSTALPTFEQRTVYGVRNNAGTVALNVGGGQTVSLSDVEEYGQ